ETTAGITWVTADGGKSWQMRGRERVGRNQIRSIDRRHLACSQTRHPIPHTSTGPGVNSSACAVAIGAVMTCTAQITPTPMAALPSRDSARIGNLCLGLLFTGTAA